MKRLSVVAAIFALALFWGCSKEGESLSDRDAILAAINGEYSAYFGVSDAFSADDEELLRALAPEDVLDSVVCWRYVDREFSRTISVDVVDDSATVVVSRTLSATARYRGFVGDSLVVSERPVSFEGTRTAVFVRRDGRWQLVAISPARLLTSPSTVGIDSVVAVNRTTGERFVIDDPERLFPVDSIFTVAPDDTFDVYAYTATESFVLFRHPRGGGYGRVRMERDGERGHRHGVRTDAPRGVGHIVVDAVTASSALDTEAEHDGEIWAMCFRIE